MAFTIDGIKEMARQTAEASASGQSQIKNTAQSLLGFDSSELIQQQLGSLLSLNEDEFKLIAPVFLSELERQYNNVNDQLLMAQAMNLQGIKVEDLQKQFEEINKQIDEEVGDKLSTQKKDFLKELMSITVNGLNESENISKRTIIIPIELCNPDAKLPTYATNGSGAMDIYCPEDVSIAPGETKLIKLGFKVDIPRGYALLIQARSGLSLKTKLRVANTPGLIDSDYHEEIGLIMENVSSHIVDSELADDGSVNAPAYGTTYAIGKGERCAQMRLVEIPMVSWLQVESLGEFTNNHGEGFGSTGTV